MDFPWETGAAAFVAELSVGEDFEAVVDQVASAFAAVAASSAFEASDLVDQVASAFAAVAVVVLFAIEASGLVGSAASEFEAFDLAVGWAAFAFGMGCIQ